MSELKYIELIREYSKESYQKLKREPAGQLQYPFIVPGSVYANELWDCLIQRIDCWSGFMAMWAGIATKEQAQRMVRENMEKPELFGGKYGIRTLAKTEKMYRIIPSGNPSCWLGPVWGIPNYMCFKGLLDYGFIKEAKELAEKTIELFGKDLETCGELHEYYDPDTGEGVNNQGFQSWNLLVNCMIAEM